MLIHFQHSQATYYRKLYLEIIAEFTFHSSSCSVRMYSVCRYRQWDSPRLFVEPWIFTSADDIHNLLNSGQNRYELFPDYAESSHTVWSPFHIGRAATSDGQTLQCRKRISHESMRRPYFQTNSKSSLCLVRGGGSIISIEISKVTFLTKTIHPRVFINTQMLKALCEKPEVGGFETRWGEWFFFSIYLILPAAVGPGVYSDSNRNEYQKQKNVSRE
jgi:hypothetical protein